jgi:hypothetical protein
MRRLFVWSGLYMLIGLVGAQTAFGQSASIQGILVDANNAAITNAKVVAIDEAKGVAVRETITDKDGSFLLLPLPRGTYTLQVEASGFKRLSRNGLVLDAYQVLNLGSVRLEVGDLANTVEVTAEIPLVETATAQKSFVITSEQVTGISTNGRDFRSLLRTLPGVTSNTQLERDLATIPSSIQFSTAGRLPA